MGESVHGRFAMPIVSTLALAQAESSAGLATLKTMRLCNWRLMLAVATSFLFTMNSGAVVGYSSPALPNLNEHRNPFHLTADEQSWVGSLLALFGAAGALAIGPTNDLLGRKLAMMTSSLFAIVGLTMVAAATDLRYLYAGVAVTAFFAQVNMAAATLYIGEVAPAEIRGTCMSLTILAFPIGIVVTNAVGIVLPWNWLAIFMAALFALPNVVLAFLPESPRWFLLKGNSEAAIHGVRWFRGGGGGGGSCDVDEIRIGVVATAVVNKRCDLSAWRHLVVDRQNRKSMFVIAMLVIFQGFSGNIVLQMFTVSIFELAGVAELDPNVEAIIAGLFSVLGSLVCPLLVDRIGRKALMITSAIVGSAAMATTAAFFQLRYARPDYAQHYLYWMPVVGLSISNFGFMAGMLPVPIILSCEMFPTNVRGSAQAVMQVLQGLAGFVCLKTFVVFQATLGISGAFFVYAGICATAASFVALFVKEQNPSSMR